MKNELFLAMWAFCIACFEELFQRLKEKKVPSRAVSNHQWAITDFP
jgi:hypothetical protein